MTQPTTAVASERTRHALLARRARTEASLAGVQETVDRMLKDKTSVTMAAVARQALFTEQGREFLQLSSQVAG